MGRICGLFKWGFMKKREDYRMILRILQGAIEGMVVWLPEIDEKRSRERGLP